MASQFIRDKLQDAIDMLMGLIQIELSSISAVGDLLIECFDKKNKCFVLGSGGSNLTAQRFAGGLLGIGEQKRIALPVFILGQDNSVISAFASAQEFENIYSRYVDAFMDKDDVLVAFSASGNNRAVLLGLEKARSKGAKSISFTGQDTTQLNVYCDYVISTPTTELSRINEAHFILVDILVEYIEEMFFKSAGSPKRVTNDKQEDQ